jgi:hypothetical protein
MKLAEIKKRRQAYPQTSPPLLDIGQSIFRDLGRDIGQNFVRNMVRDVARRSVTTTIPQPHVRLSADSTFRPRMPSFRQLARWDPPAEVKPLIAIALASDGDEELMWRRLEECLGHKPDAKLKVKLRHDFRAMRRWPLSQTLSKFHGYRDRLAKKAERSNERRREVKRLDESLYKFGELQLALSEYDDPLDEVHRAVFEVEKRLAPGEMRTVSKVE